jgi:four helix bundle protein
MSDELGSDEYSKPRDLRTRTKHFAVRVITMIRTLDDRRVGQVLGNQVLRSGTSVGAQYREACRARSGAEFISKIQSAAQEMEETLYWFELLSEARIVPKHAVVDLHQEGCEILAMLSASVKTAKQGR